MNKKVYWGLGVLIILLIGVSAVFSLRTKDTEPIIVYKGVDPSRNNLSSVETSEQEQGQHTKLPTAETESTQAAAESTPTAEKTPQTATDILTPEKSSISNTEISKARVSPFGFGEYPSIPQVYRDLGGVEDIWLHFEKLAETDPETARKQELAERVLIKLWNEGRTPSGANLTSDSDNVYPQYPNTVYVKWEISYLDDGTTYKVPVQIFGDPAFSQYELDFYESDGSLVPEGFILLDYDKDGIDPYSFLKGLDGIKSKEQ